MLAWGQLATGSQVRQAHTEVGLYTPQHPGSVGHPAAALGRRQRPEEKRWPGQKPLSVKALNAFA